MFNIHLASKAQKELNSLEENYKKKVIHLLRLLQFDPIPARFYDVKKMKGLKDTFRIRVGKLRIVYSIIWQNKDILIARIGFREKVYD